MKLLLYYIILVSTFIYCKDEAIERNYFQKDSIFTLQRIVVDSFNKDVVEYVRTKTFKFNRTRTCVNATMKVLVDVKTYVTQIIGYKFDVGVYKRIAVDFILDICKVLHKNTFGAGTLFKRFGNMKNCPFEKGTYEFHNLYIMSNKMPPGVPPGEWKIEIYATINGISAFLASMYFNVEYPIKH